MAAGSRLFWLYSLCSVTPLARGRLGSTVGSAGPSAPAPLQNVKWPPAGQNVRATAVLPSWPPI